MNTEEKDRMYKNIRGIMSYHNVDVDLIPNLYGLIHSIISLFTEAPPWHDNIPREGIRCNVSNKSEQETLECALRRETTIYEYNPSARLPYIGANSWKFAVPVDPKLRIGK